MSAQTAPLPWLAWLALLGCGLAGCHSAHAQEPGQAAQAARYWASTRSVTVELRKSSQTICPRAPVQVSVLVDGREAKKEARTSLDVAFRSRQGAFDENGFFTPHTGLRPTIAAPYEITAEFGPRPAEFSFVASYKPDYACIRTAGHGGALGTRGSDGDDGARGSAGSDGGTYGDGRPGDAGGRGRSGDSGADGAAGPHIVAYTTFVATPFYEKLLAVKLEGDVEDFVLAPADRVLVLDASGGAGGAGGAGGHGGSGGKGGNGGLRNGNGGDGGNGGAGGDGGNGGRGGAGGLLEIVYDARFPELLSLLSADVSGGRGGAAGNSGPGGNLGFGGSGRFTSGQWGIRGGEGRTGDPGKAGAPGVTMKRAASVEPSFAGIEGLTVFRAGTQTAGR
ncbi:hypothetical protein [Pendulispora rubella]|uniref:hypothetical protein n=1 Tax=Pendulispora rubella TaxID=2741070 RepID=UPI00374E1D6E